MKSDHFNKVKVYHLKLPLRYILKILFYLTKKKGRHTFWILKYFRIILLNGILLGSIQKMHADPSLDLEKY